MLQGNVPCHISEVAAHCQASKAWLQLDTNLSTNIVAVQESAQCDMDTITDFEAFEDDHDNISSESIIQYYFYQMPIH